MSEVVSAGFKTTVLPVANAGAIFQAAINRGKFQGIICAATPSGCTFLFGNAYSSSGSVPVVVHPWSSSTGFGTRYSNPSVGTTGTSEIRAIDWNPTETAIAFGGSQSPYIHAYAWFGGFGTKYSNPATLPGGIVNDAEFI